MLYLQIYIVVFFFYFLANAKKKERRKLGFIWKYWRIKLCLPTRSSDCKNRTKSRVKNQSVLNGNWCADEALKENYSIVAFIMLPACVLVTKVTCVHTCVYLCVCLCMWAWQAMSQAGNGQWKYAAQFARFSRALAQVEKRLKTLCVCLSVHVFVCLCVCSSLYLFLITKRQSF